VNIEKKILKKHQQEAKMDSKWSKSFISVAFCILHLTEKCDFVEITNSTLATYSPKEDPSILTECQIPDSVEMGYCVQIHNCVSILIQLNKTSLPRRSCGPPNQNRNKHHVCCEKQKILFTKTSTEASAESVQNCGITNISTNSRILGGEESQVGEFPWLGRLFRRDDQGELHFSCTGCLISSRVVLTAAHCVTSNNPLGDLHTVVFGEHQTYCSPADNCLEQKKTIFVRSAIAHSGYNVRSRNHDHDIGLIILRDKVEFTNYVSPICLLEEKFETWGYVVSGWGRTENDTVSNVNLKTTLPAYSWNECAEKYRSINVELTSRQICVGGMKNRDTCQGDSGGPLMVEKANGRWYAAGVVSFGVGCGKQGWPGVYTYIPNYIEWIKNTIAQQL
jgi:secreted trypsin-like serine protease